MTTELVEELGRPVNHKRIGRIMRAHDLGSRKRRRFRVVTTDSKHAHPVAPNVLGRDFAATAPTDRGSQNAARHYRDVLGARGITVSMSRKGDCWDNAPMESANGTLKVECVHGEHFRTRAEAQQAIVEYIGYYNTVRRRSSLGNVSPAEFERRWCNLTRPWSIAVSNHALSTAGRFPVRRKRPNRPAVDNNSRFVASAERGPVHSNWSSRWRQRNG